MLRIFGGSKPCVIKDICYAGMNYQSRKHYKNALEVFDYDIRACDDTS